MPVFAQYLFGLLVSLFGTYTAAYGKKAALFLAVLVFVTGIYAVFFLAVAAVISGIVLVSPDNLSIVASWVIPPEVNTAISARLSVEVLIWVVQWKNMLAFNFLKSVA